MTDEPGPRRRLGIRFVGHATVLLELDGLRVITDPVLGARLGPLRRHGPVPRAADLGAIDVALVSHAHPDHFDRPSLRALGGRPLIVVPRGLERAARSTGRQAMPLGRGESEALSLEWRVRAVRARHWRWPLEPAAPSLGYLLEGPIRVYFAGDTARYRGLAAEVGPVDVALLPVGSWGPHRTPGHLDPTDAAAVARDLGAPIAVPIHWGTFFPPIADALWPTRLAGPGARFATELERIAPGSRAVVLRPGEAATLMVAGEDG